MKIIYGLGNPGEQYKQTRHNIGFMVVDFLSLKWHIPIDTVRPDIVYGRGQIDKVVVMLAKPYTYMNLSGIPLGKLDIQTRDLIVIHDDMDIDSGKIRVKLAGGSGGHKGLESIMQELGCGEFIRIRCGIGRPPTGCEPRDYVLGHFANEEMALASRQIHDAADAAVMCLKEEYTKAMNVFNRRDKDILST